MNIKRLNRIPEKYHDKALTYFCNEEDLKSTEERPVIVFENPKYAEFNNFMS